MLWWRESASGRNFSDWSREKFYGQHRVYYRASNPRGKGTPVVGMQCDNQTAHPEDMSKWMKQDRNWLRELPSGKISANVLLEHAERSLEIHQAMFEKLIGNFMSFV